MRELFGWRYPSAVSGPWRTAPNCQHGHHGSARSGHRKRRLSRDVGDSRGGSFKVRGADELPDGDRRDEQMGANSGWPPCIACAGNWRKVEPI
jgi:hypothetical protein